MIRHFSIWVVWIYAKLFYHHKVYGKSHFNKGRAIIASNHCSFLDPPLIGISAPCEVHFLARASLFKSPWFGWLIRKLNTHPVTMGKENVQTFRLIVKFLQEGKKVVLFPEGRRSKTGELMKPQAGIGMLVMRTEAIVIPTYIHGTYKLWNPHRRFPKIFGQRTACVFGSPLVFSSLTHEDKKEAQQQIADRIMKAIGELKEWYLAGAPGGVPP